MWGGIIGLIIQLISGAVGGNVAGAAMKQYSLGTIGNSAFLPLFPALLARKFRGGSPLRRDA
jgi:hypothetical protein